LDRLIVGSPHGGRVDNVFWSEIWSDLEYDSCVLHFTETELAKASLQSALSLSQEDTADVSLRGESGKMQFFAWL
jgi:hypothetical protein